MATFTDSDPIKPISDFSVSVNWGDGSAPDTSPIITQPGGPGTTFYVTGAHTYKEEGTYSAQVTILDEGGEGPTATVSTQIIVADAPLSVVNPTVVTTNTATEGLPSVPQTVAQFTDANLFDTNPIDYTATINWGDSTASTPGTITYSGGVYTVTASHTYKEEGLYNLTVTIVDTDNAPVVPGDSSVVATNTVYSVADAPLASAAGGGFSSVEGLVGTAVLGTFTDANPAAPKADFTTHGGKITVNWGDGSAVQTLPASDLTQPGGIGTTFVITASHTYKEEGVYSPVTVTVLDEGGQTTTFTTTATVADRRSHRSDPRKATPPPRERRRAPSCWRPSPMPTRKPRSPISSRPKAVPSRSTGATAAE